MILQETRTLSNGVRIPKLGFGTWLIADADAADVVYEAIKDGYRLIDTAEAYGNERGVGEGIRRAIGEGIVTREELFVTTKLAAEIKEYDGAVAAIDESLRKADIGYFDLMLIHCPQPWARYRDGSGYKCFEGNREAWKAMEEANRAGSLKAIGVANFEQDDLEDLFEHGEIKPMVDQVLCHIGNTPFELIDFCRSNDVLVEAYSPIAHGAILGNATVEDMSDKYGVSVARLCLRYDLQLGTVPLPKSENPEHIASNTEVDFEISEEDMDTLEAVSGIDYGESSKFSCFRA